MRVGRRPLGPGLVLGLPGGEIEKERLRAMLATIAGACTIEEACGSVGLGRSRFLELRERALAGALEALAPGIPGRPPKRIAIDPREVDALRRANGWLREELEIARARTEIALVSPELLREPVRGKAQARARRTPERSGARRRDIARGSSE